MLYCALQSRNTTACGSLMVPWSLDHQLRLLLMHCPVAASGLSLPHCRLLFVFTAPTRAPRSQVARHCRNLHSCATLECLDGSSSCKVLIECSTATSLRPGMTDCLGYMYTPSM